VSWTTRNGSNAGATTPVAAWHDRVVLSSDLILGNADDRVVANIAHDGAVPVGGSYTVTTNVTLPPDASGNWNLYLVTDPFNVVYEFQYEGNNASTNQPITIRFARSHPDGGDGVRGGQPGRGGFGFLERAEHRGRPCLRGLV